MYTQTNKWKKGSKLFIPETARKEVFYAKVLKVGPGRAVDVDEDNKPIVMPMKVEPGQDILFSRYHGERIEIDGKEYIVMRQDDVLGLVNVGEDGWFKPAGTGDLDERSLEEAKDVW
jgi:chaperonin GroES